LILFDVRHVIDLTSIQVFVKEIKCVFREERKVFFCCILYVLCEKCRKIKEKIRGHRMNKSTNWI
jgi:hypothetical protein